MSRSSFRAVLEGLMALSSPAVLATVVEADEGAFCRVGTRALLLPGGGLQGVLGTGGFEQDLASRAASVLEADRPLLVHGTTETDPDFGPGTAILLSPVCPQDGALAWAHRALQAQAERRSGVLLTCYVSAEPTRVGSTTWWDPNQPHPHLLPGAQAEARRVLAGEAPASLRFGEDLILAEPILPPPTLWILGAGEAARPLALGAQTLGWEVGILDPRPALATPERFPGARWTVVDALDHLPASFQADARTAAIVLDHPTPPMDALVHQLLERGLPCVGFLGGRQRVARLREDLTKAGDVDLNRLHTPPVLDLAGAPAEAHALAVLAEVQIALHRSTPR